MKLSGFPYINVCSLAASFGFLVYFLPILPLTCVSTNLASSNIFPVNSSFSTGPTPSFSLKVARANLSGYAMW